MKMEKTGSNFSFYIFGVNPQISDFICSLRSQIKSKISGRIWDFQTFLKYSPEMFFRGCPVRFQKEIHEKLEIPFLKTFCYRYKLQNKNADKVEK